MVGRLQVSVDGRPIMLLAENQKLTICCNGIFSALKLRRSGGHHFRVLQQLFKISGIHLLIKIGWLGSFELFPKPSFGIGFIVPRKVPHKK